ncbi:hypothetical protein JessAGP_050c [Caulobacter phage Jess A]|nr:hypothetical protein JessAGP_050c [Caulobacter phage Jess A]WCA46459.1 hypothetical protein [Caulobacter phage RapA]
MSSILPGADLNLAGSPTPSDAQRIASYTDVGKYVIGREYLGKWYNLWRASPGATPQIVVRGDSTIEGGTNISNALYKPTAMLTTFARAKGFVMTAVNGGVSGTTTNDWLNTHLPADLVTYAGSPPPLYIIHYGMNDPRSNAANMTPAQTIAALKAGLALLRATWSAQQTSVLVVLPNTAAWDAVGVNEAWREAINYQYTQACRDYGVTCFDTYAWAREARYGLLSGWLDSPAVHPNEDFNALIWGAIADVMFPTGLQMMNGATTLISDLSAGYTNPGIASGGACVTKRGDMVMATGYIAKTTPATIAANTLLMNIPAGFEPVDSRVYGVQLAAFDGSTWQYVHAELRQASNSNNLLLREAISLTATQIHFGPGVWRH